MGEVSPRPPMVRRALRSPTVASLLPIALATVLAAVAVKVTIQRLNQFSWRYQTYDFVVFFDWGTRYRAGADVWSIREEGEVRPGKRRHICNLTPAFVEAFVPLTLLDKPLAHSIWLKAQLVFLVLALWIVAREIDPPPDTATVVILV